jgi:enhancer of polycomb-like protein
LYPKGWQQPNSYIRSSDTVEDYAGTPYCMDEDDELALKLINTRLPAGQTAITEDAFEKVMTFFEEAAQIKQPYAAVDSPPVLALEELEEHFDDTHDAEVRSYTKIVYDHWVVRRSSNSNRGLAPHLKFETGQESDDSDPYVCFRRRELRQIRKTRNRDAQSAEKLRKLRMELEAARNIVLMIRRREVNKRDVLAIDRQVYEQRQQFRETKRKLAIKGDEELLINQKKQKVPQGMTPNQAALAQQLRMPGLTPGGPGTDLRTLEDVMTERNRTIASEISLNIDKHSRWNEGYVDKTKSPLTPDSDDGQQPGGFREAMPAMEYLPTPPASNHDEQQNQTESQVVETKVDSGASTPFRYASPADDSDSAVPMPAFRRRVGRGGRVIFDRKFPIRAKADANDQWKYDSDHDDEGSDDEPDPFARMAQRAMLVGAGRPPDAQAQAAIAAARKAQIDAANSSSSPAMPTIAQASNPSVPV